MFDLCLCYIIVSCIYVTFLLNKCHIYIKWLCSLAAAAAFVTLPLEKLFRANLMELPDRSPVTMDFVGAVESPSRLCGATVYADADKLSA